MNILHIEEMIEVEKALLLTQPHQRYLLHLPSSDQVGRLSTQTTHAFSPSSLAAQQEVEKMLTHTKNLKSLKQNDPNATFKAFTYAVLAIIYPSATGPRIAPTNNLLLETLKCTLYSTDVSFNGFSECGISVEDQQGKAMVARFFDVLATEKDALGSNFSKYVETFLEKNQVLITIFTLFYRLVLSKLAIEGAEDYNTAVNFEEALINLAEYFDISYRNRAELFLFYQDNIFMAMADDEVVLGGYLDNEIDPKEVSFKDSQGFNLIQSFLLRSSQKECRQRVADKEKEKDIPKLFNFSFESGEFRYLKGDTDQGTPHFKESSELVFGRKKKEDEPVLKDEEFKNELSKANLNASIDSFKDFNFKQCMAILKSIEERQKFLNNETENLKSLGLLAESKDKQIFQTPIKQLDEKLEQSKISVDRCRNIVNVKDKNMTLLTPQAQSNVHECFSKIDNDAIFLKNSNGHGRQSSSENIDEMRSDKLINCKCRAYRLTRNSLSSTVVNFAYVPVQKRKLRPPPFISNLSHSQKLILCSSSRIKSPKLKRLKTLEEKPIEEAKEERKPAFLKCLKKNRELTEKESLSSFEQSKRSQQSKQSNSHFTGILKQPAQKQDKFKRLSAIHNKTHNENKIKDLQFRETLRRNDYHYYFPNKKKPVQNNTVLKKFDTNNMLYRPALGNNWQSATNFHQVTQTPRRFPKDNINATAQTGEKVTKLYTPTVHIIAPAIYLHSNSHQNSKASFKVDSPQNNEKVDLKDSHRILRTESSIHIKKEGK